MADILNSIKKTWLKGMEAVGNAASNIASNTKQKVSEMNLENRRREILADFGLIAYEMWQKGTEFPKELNEQLTELGHLDEELNALRAQRFKDVNEANDTITPDTDQDMEPSCIEDGCACDQNAQEPKQEDVHSDHTETTNTDDADL